MKIRFKLKTFFSTLTFLLILFIIMIAILQVIISLKPVKYIKYKNLVFAFRDDVRKAEKIKVYPNEYILGQQFWDYKIHNITILFKPDENYNKYYQLAAFELTYKLTQMYMTLRPIIIEKNFSAQEIQSFENITREENVLKIVIVPPEHSDETVVKVASNRVYIYWKSPRDLDLAVMKVILSALKYNANYTLIT
ncbi:MAG: hypothetical protein QXO84_01620 [Candidatus Aenigmatarchaeota archaeon]